MAGQAINDRCNNSDFYITTVVTILSTSQESVTARVTGRRFDYKYNIVLSIVSSRDGITGGRETPCDKDGPLNECYHYCDVFRTHQLQRNIEEEM